MLIRSRTTFETMTFPYARWSWPWNSVTFSVPSPSLRIHVRDIDTVTPFYVEKLGLRKLIENPPGESDGIALKFKADGNSVILTDRQGFMTGRTPILFTKKISKMRDILAARGVAAGAIQQDRQGTNYLEIHDPEGNTIEVVEEK